ncbi:MAG: YceI family protein [Helicobacter sp.]|nr:YceI family protein [Helicobacter sp.]
MKMLCYGKFLLLVGIVSAALYARDYSVREDSQIGFSVGKFLVLNVEGRFQKFGGTLTLDSQNQITALNGEVIIDSVTTENAKRDAHLLAPDFLDAANFPTAQLSLISYAPNSSEDSSKITGKLTALLELHGSRQHIEFDSVLVPETDNPKLLLRSECNIKDFGIEGSMMHNNSVTIELQTTWQ